MRPPGWPRPDPGADPAYAGLKARVIARTGHHYYADKDGLLLDRLHRRLRATGAADCAAYAALLSAGAAGEAEWQRLEAEITVGETFFFRYAEQFAALRKTILPGLVAARAPERVLRIWSAGCSTGAEPYSLAILVREILGDALPGWRVSILGTDISAEALAVARAAEYGRWALRSMPPEERLRYFTRLPPRPGALREGGYALRPEYRAMVRFARGNLLRLAEPGPPPPEEGGPFDLILCRNVLIYFEAETVAALVRGLGRRLRRDGWLLLGHAEPNPAFSAFLDAASLPGTVVYRPRGEPVPTADAREPRGAGLPDDPHPLDGRPEPESPLPAGHGSPRVPPPAAPASGRPVDGAAAPRGADPPPPDGAAPRADGDSRADGDPRARVRALADAGQTGAAWRLLREALSEAPTDPVLRFYEGLLARALGRETEAERALRAALYLDRGFVMAHYHLGLLLQAGGRAAEAARALDNAAVLSQALPPETLLPEGGGASAGEIAAGMRASRAPAPAGGAEEGDP